MRWWKELRDILREGPTLSDLAQPRGWRRRGRLAGWWLREAVAAAREADLATLASALTYKTLLSLVPVAAVTLAILSTVDDGRYARMLVDYIRAELPHAALDGVIDTVESLGRNAWKVAGGGALFFLWTVFTLFGTVENAFGRVWRVARGRSWRRRVPAYVSTLILVPVLLCLSVMATSWLGQLSQAGAPRLTRFVMGGSAWALTTAGMTALYYLLPATRVRLRAALAGGVVAGTLLELAKWGFRVYADYAVRSLQNMYDAAVYGPLLAALPLFLLWLWLMWSMALGGAALAYVAQRFRQLLAQRRLEQAGDAWRARAAAWALRLAARDWRRGTDPSRLDARLAERAGIPPHDARVVLEQLTEAGVLHRLADRDAAYVPRAESTAMSLADAVLAVRDAPLWMPDAADGAFDRWLAERFASASTAEREALSRPGWTEAVENDA